MDIPNESDEGLRAQVAEIHKNPAWGKDPALEAQVDKLYQDRYGSGTVEIGGTEGITIRGRDADAASSAEAAPAALNPETYGPDAEARNNFILGQLREEWGGDFDVRGGDARAAGRALFTEHEWRHDPGAVFQDLGARIRKVYGPTGEKLAVKFLADLGQLKRKGE